MEAKKDTIIAEEKLNTGKDGSQKRHYHCWRKAQYW
jgi:hypothetical protein